MTRESLGITIAILLLVATLGALITVFAGTVMLFFPSSRRTGGQLALFGGIALVVLAGLCFVGLPLIAG